MTELTLSRTYLQAKLSSFKFVFLHKESYSVRPAKEGVIPTDGSYQVREVPWGFASNFMGRVGMTCRSAIDVCMSAVPEGCFHVREGRLQAGFPKVKVY